MGLFPEWAAIAIAVSAVILIGVLIVADRRAAKRRDEADADPLEPGQTRP